MFFTTPARIRSDVDGEGLLFTPINKDRKPVVSSSSKIYNQQPSFTSSSTNTTPFSKLSPSQLNELFTPSTNKYREEYDLIEKDSPLSTQSEQLKRVSVEPHAKNSSNNHESRSIQFQRTRKSMDGSDRHLERKKLLEMVESLFEDDDDNASVSDPAQSTPVRSPKIQNSSVSHALKSNSSGTVKAPPRFVQYQFQLPDLNTDEVTTAGTATNSKITFKYESDEEKEDRVFLKSEALERQARENYLADQLTSSNSVERTKEHLLQSSSFTTDQGIATNTNMKRQSHYHKYNEILSSLLMEVDRLGEKGTLQVEDPLGNLTGAMQQIIRENEVQGHLNSLRAINKELPTRFESNDPIQNFEKFLLLPPSELEALMIKQHRGLLAGNPFSEQEEKEFNELYLRLNAHMV